MSRTWPAATQTLGCQRDWVWRGWQIRYTYRRSNRRSNSIAPGKYPPVLLLHGFGASIGHWEYNLDFLAMHHTVYALDLVGFGASRKPKIEYDIDLWVDLVYDFWQTWVGQPMVLVGNSIGALIALVAAAKYPEMAATTIMISLPDLSAEQEMIPRPIQPLVNGIKRSIANPLVLNPLFKFVSKPKIARKWAQIAYANPQCVTDDLLDLFLTPAREVEAQSAFVKIIQGMTSSNFSPNLRQLLPHIRIPMLMVWGQQDRMIPPGIADNLLALNPYLKLVNLESAGHCAHHEQPEAVNKIMRHWLDAIIPSC